MNDDGLGKGHWVDLANVHERPSPRKAAWPLLRPRSCSPAPAFLQGRLGFPRAHSLLGYARTIYNLSGVLCGWWFSPRHDPPAWIPTALCRGFLGRTHRSKLDHSDLRLLQPAAELLPETGLRFAPGRCELVWEAQTAQHLLAQRNVFGLERKVKKKHSLFEWANREEV